MELSQLKRHKAMKSHYVPAVSKAKTTGLFREVNGPIKCGNKFSNKRNVDFWVTKVMLSRLETLETKSV